MDKTSLYSLPVDLFLCLAEYTSAKDLASLRAVNREIREKIAVSTNRCAKMIIGRDTARVNKAMDDSVFAGMPLYDAFKLYTQRFTLPRDICREHEAYAWRFTKLYYALNCGELTGSGEGKRITGRANEMKKVVLAMQALDYAFRFDHQRKRLKGEAGGPFLDGIIDFSDHLSGPCVSSSTSPWLWCNHAIDEDSIAEIQGRIRGCSGWIRSAFGSDNFDAIFASLKEHTISREVAGHKRRSDLKQKAIRILQDLPCNPSDADKLGGTERFLDMRLDTLLGLPRLGKGFCYELKSEETLSLLRMCRRRPEDQLLKAATCEQIILGRIGRR